jgi:hypothetical protein
MLNQPDHQRLESVDGKVMVNYYSKEAGESFAEFLKNPVAAAPSRSVAEPGEYVEMSDGELFASLWASLTDEERAKVLENADTAEVEINDAIGVDADSETGRGLLARNSAEISDLIAGLEFAAKLKDRLNDREVPLSYVGLGMEENDIDGTEVPAYLAIQKLFAEKNWDSTVVILEYLNMEAFEEELKTSWDVLAALGDSQTMERSIARSSSSSSSDGATYSGPMISNLGGSLRDGDVIVASGKGTAYVFGTYNHGGIFSRTRYTSGGSTDYVHSVYTAQPSWSKDYETDIRPDRPGYACLDTLRIYTRQKKLAVIEPINYTQTNAATAVNYAKSIYYDTWPSYDLPILEALWLGNSSHDLTNKNTYCSKVAYTAWRKAGVNLDADRLFGNLVVPDDLYYSGYDVYRTITIKILFWTVYSKTEKVYSGTSYIRRTAER